MIGRREWLVGMAGALGGPALMRARTFAGTTPGTRLCLAGGRIRWLVGWSPGGGYDAYSRLVEPFLEQKIGAEITISNLPGAGGRVAAITLSRARPDGRTLGILDGSGILWAAASGERDVPALDRGFTLLGRIASMEQVLVAGPRSGVTSMEELLALARSQRLVCGVTAPGSQNFVTASVLMRILGIEADFITGYAGSREIMLGLLRGDFDVTALSIESGLDVLGPDRARPLLQISHGGAHPRLRDIPYLDSRAQLIDRQPGWFADEPDRARRIVADVVAYLRLGRLLAGPPGMADGLRLCMREAVSSVLEDPAFEAAATRANRTLSPATADRVLAEIPAASEAIRRVAPIAAEAVHRTR